MRPVVWLVVTVAAATVMAASLWWWSGGFGPHASHVLVAAATQPRAGQPAVPRRVFVTKGVFQRTWSQRTWSQTWSQERWTEAQMDVHMQRRWPTFYRETWPHLDTDQRDDAVRCCWLYDFGGVCLKEPFRPTRELTPLLCHADAAYVTAAHATPDGTTTASTAVMASVPGHPFWLDVLARFRALPTSTVGAVAVAETLRLWHRARRSEPVVVLSQHRLGLGRTTWPLRTYGKRVT